jgi:hypothetical protein
MIDNQDEAPFPENVDNLGNPEPTDETITQEQINEMKMLGLPKPRLVSWERWQRIQNVRIEHQHMIQLAAMGYPQKKIAQEMGYTDASVSKILNTPEVKSEVNKIVQETYGDNIKKAMKDRALKAVTVVDDILDNPLSKSSDRLSAATYILDHTVGKPQQQINHTGNFIMEIMDEATRITKLREANPITPELTGKPDPFDTVLEQIVPSNVVVGKRSNVKEGSE